MGFTGSTIFMLYAFKGTEETGRFPAGPQYDLDFVDSFLVFPLVSIGEIKGVYLPTVLLHSLFTEFECIRVAATISFSFDT